MLLLQEFDFTIKHTLGKEHALTDFLLCITTGEPSKGIADELLHVHLINIEVATD